jgi:hypothetical protein
VSWSKINLLLWSRRQHVYRRSRILAIASFPLEGFFVSLLFASASMFCYEYKNFSWSAGKMQGIGQLICNIRGIQYGDDLYYSLPFCHRTIWRLNTSISEKWIASYFLDPWIDGRIFIRSLVLLTCLHCLTNQRAQIAVRGCIFFWTLTLLTWAHRRQQNESRGSTLFWTFCL